MPAGLAKDQGCPILPVVSMYVHLDTSWHVAVVLGLLAFAVVSFALEKISLEATSVGLLVALLVWFQVFPVLGTDGTALLGPAELLRGFANPSLAALLCLVIMGEGLVYAGALPWVARPLLRVAGVAPRLGVVVLLLAALLLSAFLNNTPVVVLGIPLLQVLLPKLRWQPSRVMMSLSYLSILGGMTTLIGSSTNLLVSNALTDLGEAPLSFFGFFGYAAPMAAAGAAYSIFLLPRLLPDRSGLADHLLSQDRRFLGEIDVIPGCQLAGKQTRGGKLDAIPDVKLLLVQRGEDTFAPEIEDVEIAPGDVLIVRATREAMASALSRNLGHLLAREEEDDGGGNGRSRSTTKGHVVAEVMIPPASAMIDRTVDGVGFHRRHGCLVIGIQHHGRIETCRLARTRLEAGDELLIAGPRDAVEALRDNPDVVLMGRGIAEVPRSRRAPHAVVIFALTVLVAAAGVLPIVVAAFLGVAAMLVVGCLDLQRAWRALDRKILLLVASTLALSTALQATGAASLVARTALAPLSNAGPTLTLVLLFGAVAFTTNLLSNNATAILFTPIAVTLARDLGVSPTSAALAVLFGANCSFVTPIGYQTNLLVMGPGHYRFTDFVRGGLPLVVIVTVIYALTIAIVGP